MHTSFYESQLGSCHRNIEENTFFCLLQFGYGIILLLKLNWIYSVLTFIWDIILNHVRK